MRTNVLRLFITVLTMFCLLYPLVSEGQDYIFLRSWTEMLEGIAVDTKVYVADTNKQRIQVFEPAFNSITCNLASGWNMVGSLSSSVPTSSLTTDPPGQIFSFAYKWDTVTQAYIKAYSIEPGVGYFIGAFSDCTLTMNGSSPSPPSPQATNEAVPSWKGILSIQTQKEHRELVLGMHKQASDGVDVSFDEPVPPLPESMGSLSAGFVVDGSPFTLLSKSIVQEDSESEIELAVELTESGKLSWKAFPESYRCLLLYDGQSLDMHKESSLSLPTGKHSLRILLNAKSSLPEKTQLLSNYPNPFNPETWIPFELSKDTKVEIMIYASSGQLVRRLDLGHKSAGRYIWQDKSAYWDGKNEVGEYVGSGIYFYTIKAGNFAATRKMVMMK